MKHEEVTFEKAYDRLEEILEKMNSEAVSLEQALSLYEEADGLIATCQKRLTAAEQKIETLLKKHDGSLVMNSENRPETTPFHPPQQSALHD